MSRQYSETNGTVNGASCSYATLTNYNNGVRGGMASPPLRMGDTAGYYVVPTYGAPGYSTLQYPNSSGQSSCSGYPDIEGAYRFKGQGNCNQQYVRKLCQ